MRVSTFVATSADCASGCETLGVEYEGQSNSENGPRGGEVPAQHRASNKQHEAQDQDDVGFVFAVGGELRGLAVFVNFRSSPQLCYTSP